MLGYADDETCFGTDRVTGVGPVSMNLVLIEYPAEPGNQAGAFVSVATPTEDGYKPVQGGERVTATPLRSWTQTRPRPKPDTLGEAGRHD